MSKRFPSVPRGVVFALAVLFSVFLLWFGSLLIFAPGTRFNDGPMAIVGISLILVSVFMFGTVKGAGYSPFVMIALIGFYACARSIDFIAYPWLARVIGVVIWLSVPLLLYRTWPYRETKGPGVAPGPAADYDLR